MLKVFRDAPAAKVVYIAPMKALVRERIADWKQRFERQLGKKVGLRDSASCLNTILLREHPLSTYALRWRGVSKK